MSKPIAIYIRCNTINGKEYVGQSVDPRYRWRVESHENTAIGRSVRKYGEPSFESKILFWVDTLEAANWWECYLIELYGTLRPKGYNVAEGGSHGNPFAGKTSEEMGVIRRKWSDAQKGKKSTAETRRKLSQFNRGKTLTDEHKRKLSEAHKGKVFSEETRRKLSEAHTGKIVSDETRRKLSGIRGGEKNASHSDNRKRRAGVVQLKLFEREDQ